MSLFLRGQKEVWHWHTPNVASQGPHAHSKPWIDLIARNSGDALKPGSNILLIYRALHVAT